MDVWLNCVSVCRVHAWCLRKPEECTGSDGCDLPGGFQETNTGSPEEQPGLLTPEPSLQPWNLLFVFLACEGEVTVVEEAGWKSASTWRKSKANLKSAFLVGLPTAVSPSRT